MSGYNEITDLGSKNDQSQILVYFPFDGLITQSSDVASVLVFATVYTGIHVAPSAIISGAATYSTTRVNSIQQKIIGGVAGVIYALSCVLVHSNGQIFYKTGYLAVTRDLP